MRPLRTKVARFNSGTVFWQKKNDNTPEAPDANRFEMLEIKAIVIMVLPLPGSPCIHKNLDPSSFHQSKNAGSSCIQAHEFSSNLSLVDSMVRISSRGSVIRKSRKH